jgi:hypothetical protein
MGGDAGKLRKEREVAGEVRGATRSGVLYL